MEEVDGGNTHCLRLDGLVTNEGHRRAASAGPSPAALANERPAPSPVLPVEQRLWRRLGRPVRLSRLSDNCTHSLHSRRLLSLCDLSTSPQLSMEHKHQRLLAPSLGSRAAAQHLSHSHLGFHPAGHTYPTERWPQLQSDGALRTEQTWRFCPLRISPLPSGWSTSGTIDLTC